MAIPDPTLGIQVDFPKDTFEGAIRFAMQMGLPTDPDKRPKFVKKSTARTYFKDGTELPEVPRLDRDGNPFDPDIEVRKGAESLVTTPRSATNANTVDCAIEVLKADAEELPVGNFRPTKAIITVLNTDYPRVAGSQELRYNGDTYRFGYEPENDGLFDSGINQLVFYCLDDA